MEQSLLRSASSLFYEMTMIRKQRHLEIIQSQKVRLIYAVGQMCTFITQDKDGFK
jgi:hypothetical protein